MTIIADFVAVPNTARRVAKPFTRGFCGSSLRELT
jgi:hypothetical protein